VKRFLIGSALLVALLLGGILATIVLSNRFEPMEDQLRQSAREALEENWQQAQSLSRQVQQQWHLCWPFTAVFSEHDPMEQIDALFAQLEIYGQEKLPVPFATLCARLAQELSDLGEDHIFTWWNIL